MSGLEAFEISVDQAVLDDLARRLDRTRWPDPPLRPGRELGLPPDVLAGFVERWRHEFSWRAFEAGLRRHRHVRVEVDAQPVHAMVVPSSRPDAVPVVLLHGWPSAFTEFAGLAARLTDPPDGPAFHVVVPSLPGFGFSGPTRRPGWTPRRIAGAVAELMAELGYARYLVHGGDWGAMVASQLGQTDPTRVAGIHLSMVIAPRPDPADGGTDADPTAGLTEAELADLAAMRAAGRTERGYRDIQATRPQSLAALADSPVGLAAWILEKFDTWSDAGLAAFDPDALLGIVTLYWVTGTIVSSCRIYAESRRAGPGASLPVGSVPVPMAHARFPGEGFRPPRRWVEGRYRVRRWSEFDRGGHFPALEVPELLAADLGAFAADLDW